MVRAVIVASLASILISLSAASTPASGHFCGPRISDQLDRLNVDRARIESIFVTRQARGREDGEITVGYDAWVRFSDCQGYLIIGLHRGCGLREAYTRGDCRVPGARHFC